jgi:hypothetical protein
MPDCHPGVPFTAQARRVWGDPCNLDEAQRFSPDFYAFLMPRFYRFSPSDPAPVSQNELGEFG